MIDDMSEEDAKFLLHEYGGLVRYIAKLACYSSSTIDIHDLYRIGEYAVLQAVKSYDPSCGTTIKSFVSKVVRNEIFHEAARFLGIFTVDHRVTRLAAKVNKLYDEGHDDEKITMILNETFNRNFDESHIRDLRITYDKRQYVNIIDDDIEEHNLPQGNDIQELLRSVVKNSIEETILHERILGETSVKDLSHILDLSQRKIYILENQIKERIRIAIKDTTE